MDKARKHSISIELKKRPKVTDNNSKISIFCFGKILSPKDIRGENWNKKE